MEGSFLLLYIARVSQLGSPRQQAAVTEVTQERDEKGVGTDLGNQLQFDRTRVLWVAQHFSVADTGALSNQQKSGGRSRRFAEFHAHFSD
jgi:hypothetical protein